MDYTGRSSWTKRVPPIKNSIEVLGQRIEYFHQHGCRASDHALDTLRYKEADETVLEEIFQKARANKLLSSDEIDAYRTETLIRLTHFYHSHNWTMQLHIHAYRNCNTQMLKKLDPIPVMME